MARIILHSRGFQGACEDNIPIETLEKLKIRYTHKFLFCKIIDWEAIYVDWWYSGGGQQTVDKLVQNTKNKRSCNKMENYEKLYKSLISRLQWHDIEKEQPDDGSTVEIRVLYTRDELENKKDLTYDTAFHINYYYGIYGEYGENGRNFLSSYYEKHLRKSNKYLTIDKGYNEWSRYFSGKGDKLDFRGDYILWEDTVRVPDNRKIEWRYLVEENGDETHYTAAI